LSSSHKGGVVLITGNILRSGEKTVVTASESRASHKAEKKSRLKKKTEGSDDSVKLLRGNGEKKNGLRSWKEGGGGSHSGGEEGGGLRCEEDVADVIFGKGIMKKKRAACWRGGGMYRKGSLREKCSKELVTRGGKKGRFWEDEAGGCTTKGGGVHKKSCMKR